MSPGRSLIGNNRRRSAQRLLWTLILGLFLGGLFTKLSELFLPESAARDFLTTSVKAAVGPFSIDLVAVALTVGPLEVTLNVLTRVGVGIVAFVARSWI
ncbi:MAG: hypothetical protein MUO50_17175 [Longimicrobiales bacterium]|nr:hypothetical protein [Longimicrobiales bacterium]